MIEILIVDDNREKMAEIENQIKNFFGETKIDITKVVSVQDACLVTLLKKFDLLILDMELPTYTDEDMFDNIGGINIVETLDLESSLEGNKTMPFIIFVSSKEKDSFIDKYIETNDYKLDYVVFDFCTNWEKKFFVSLNEFRTRSLK